MANGVSFVDAAAAALAEVDMDDNMSSVTDVNGDGAAFDDGTGLQDNQPEEHGKGVFDDLNGNADNTTNPDAGSGDNVVEVPDHGQVPLAELIRVFLDRESMKKDYTQKTQAAAEQRRENEDAVRLLEALRSDPQATIRNLAQEFGVQPTYEQNRQNALWKRVEEMSGQAPQSAPTNKQLDQLTDQVALTDAIKKALSDMPELQELRKQQALANVNNAIGALEQRYNVVFSNDDKVLLLQKAREVGGNLQAAYTLLRDEVDQSRAARQNVADAATVKQSARTTTGDADEVDVSTFQGALKAAMDELNMSDIL